MKNLSVMIKPVSSLCDMHCTYCFYRDEASLRSRKNLGILTKEKAQIIIEKLSNYLIEDDVIDLGFQGGEPSLAGVDFYRYFFEKITKKCKAKINFYFQTNGLKINEDFCNLFKQYNVLVGLSLDMNKAFHDKYRKTNENQNTWQQVMAVKTLFDKTKTDYNIMSVLTNEMAMNPDKVWTFIKNNNLEYVQFIPCLGKLSEKDKKTEFELSPKLFYEFYKTLFDYWLLELKNGSYYSIKFFDDIVHLVRDKMVCSCGIDGRCQKQIIVEADGTTYPCDFYCLDEYKTGNIYENSLEEILTNTKSFTNKKHQSDKLCLNCKFKELCNGNCPRQKNNMCIENSTCYYSHLLEYIIPQSNFLS